MFLVTFWIIVFLLTKIRSTLFILQGATEVLLSARTMWEVSCYSGIPQIPVPLHNSITWNLMAKNLGGKSSFSHFCHSMRKTWSAVGFTLSYSTWRVCSNMCKLGRANDQEVHPLFLYPEVLKLLSSLRTARPVLELVQCWQVLCYCQGRAIIAKVPYILIWEWSTQ